MKNPKFGELIVESIAVDDSRLRNGEIVKSTYRYRTLLHNEMRAIWGDLHIDQISVRTLQATIDGIRLSGTQFKAKRWRQQLIEVYNEAQRQDLIPLGFNPAGVTRSYRVAVARSRLRLDEWQSVYDLAGIISPKWFKNAMLLALITGQRRSDLVKMKFSDIWDKHLHVTQHKTGNKVAIPIKIKCEAIGMSLSDIIKTCRDDSEGCDWLLSKNGKKLSPWSLTFWFFKLYKYNYGEWEKEGLQPTLHEIRSLSERLYRKQGLDTRLILGHKNQATTDGYNDDRGTGWMMVQLP